MPLTRSISKAFAVAGLSLVLIACGATSSQPRPPRPSGASEIGQASYYADRYQGQLTANGERYDRRSLTAAHKRLAFDTRVRVTNLDNGRSVVVRINDRGPFVRGRIIDLSRAAFSEIAQTRLGIVDVRVDVLD